MTGSSQRTPTACCPECDYLDAMYAVACERCGDMCWVWNKWTGAWQPCPSCADADGYPRKPKP